jgi:hypothetical protein
MMTDKALLYKKLGREFAEHGTTLHSNGWYVDLNDKARFRSSSALCAACISIVANSTYTATLPSSSSDIITGLPTAAMIAPVRTGRLAASLVSVSPTKQLTSHGVRKWEERQILLPFLWRGRVQHE